MAAQQLYRAGSTSPGRPRRRRSSPFCRAPREPRETQPSPRGAAILSSRGAGLPTLHRPHRLVCLPASIFRRERPNPVARDAASAGSKMTAREATRGCNDQWLTAHHTRGATCVRPGGWVALSANARALGAGITVTAAEAGVQQLWSQRVPAQHLWHRARGPRRRSGQPLAVTLNGTVRVLTYKQEVGGSSPSPPSRVPSLLAN